MSRYDVTTTVIVWCHRGRSHWVELVVRQLLKPVWWCLYDLSDVIYDWCCVWRVGVWKCWCVWHVGVGRVGVCDMLFVWHVCVCDVLVCVTCWCVWRVGVGRVGVCDMLFVWRVGVGHVACVTCWCVWHVCVCDMLVCNSSLGKVAPHLSVDQIRPGVLFMAPTTRGDNFYRGVVLGVEGRRVCGSSFLFTYHRNQH